MVSKSTPPRHRAKVAVKPALALPHEVDESIHTTAPQPDPVMVQAKRDLDAGLVDTDMHATAGLDAERRASLVPGSGGQRAAVTPLSLAEQKSDFTAEGAPPPGKVATSPRTTSRRSRG
jgi:hypothetical protein